MNNAIFVILVSGLMGSFKLLLKTWFGLAWVFALFIAWVGIPTITPLGFVQNGLSLAELIGYAFLSFVSIVLLLGILNIISNSVSNWISR